MQECSVDVTMLCHLGFIASVATAPLAIARVGGDVCPLRVCSEAEAKYNCSLWHRSDQVARLLSSLLGSLPTSLCEVASLEPA